MEKVSKLQNFPKILLKIQYHTLSLLPALYKFLVIFINLSKKRNVKHFWQRIITLFVCIEQSFLYRYVSINFTSNVIKAVISIVESQSQTRWIDILFPIDMTKLKKALNFIENKKIYNCSVKQGLLIMCIKSLLNPCLQSTWLSFPN